VQSPSTGGTSTVVLSNTPKKLGEVYAMQGGSLRQLTHQNDELLKELDLPDTELVSFKSKDGTDINGLLTYPVGYVKGTRVPFILRIHGGPNGQDQYDFAMERQVFAANGYAVLNVNYRGSAGRGRKFSWAIASDWGNHEVADLEAGIDYAIKIGVADPEHMGVGGWSYGGILTDYMISMARINTSFSTTMRLARHGTRKPGKRTKRSPIRSCMPTGSRLLRCSWAASAISMSRCRAASRCIRRCAASASIHS
jgi:dipeptidyl aminopeptidase/acylaminoacyl peptidase